MPAHPLQGGVWAVRGSGSKAASPTAGEGRNAFARGTLLSGGQRVLLAAQGTHRERRTQRMLVYQQTEKNLLLREQLLSLHGQEGLELVNA